MKNLHDIAPEKQKLSWNKIKLTNWVMDWQNLNTAMRFTTESLNTFRNYYINYPTIGIVTIPAEGTYNLTYTVNYDDLGNVLSNVRATDGI